MTWTYDPSTDAGKVRLRISDTDSDRTVMSDEEITACLDMAGNSIPLAAAMALESIAVNEILCLKVVNLMGAIQTDAASASKVLMALAQKLRDEHTNGPPDEAGFLTIEMVDGTEAREEKWRKHVESEMY